MFQMFVLEVCGKDFLHINTKINSYHEICPCFKKRLSHPPHKTTFLSTDNMSQFLNTFTSQKKKLLFFPHMSIFILNIILQAYKV
jgi:hypothetical protein